MIVEDRFLGDEGYLRSDLDILMMKTVVAQGPRVVKQI